MSKKVLLLFQDCLHCERYEKWLSRQQEVARKHKIKIVETPFTAPGAKDLILEGDKKGFEALPFFTDGAGKFSKKLADFIETARPTKRKKFTKKVEEKIDEVVPEA